jgi:hypothetical protein
MAQKVKTAGKKPAKSKINKGDSLMCEVCGLSIVVEDVGGVEIAEENALLCCGKPMKKKVSKAKMTKK